MSCDRGLAPTTDTGIRQRPTGSQLHEVIVIDCDEFSDTPPVRFYVTTALVWDKYIRSENGAGP